MTGKACFLGWLSGARGCGPTLLLIGAAGVLVGRRGDDEATVFMFLSSLCEAGPRDLGPAKAAVRRPASNRRGFEGWEEQPEDSMAASGFLRESVR